MDIGKGTYMHTMQKTPGSILSEATRISFYFSAIKTEKLCVK